MGTDNLLVFVGFILMLFGGIMLLFYLFREHGSILDVISVSWAGYILYIAIAMFATGLFLPARMGLDARGLTVAMMVFGTIFYTLGLYAGKGSWLARIIPNFPSTLNMAQIWFIWFICIVVAVIFMFGFVRTTGAFGAAGGLFVQAALSALGMLTVLVLFSYRGRYFNKLVMFITAILLIYVLYRFSWSRRPLMGFFITATAFIYKYKISWRPMGIKWLFMISIAFSGLFLLLLLGATRGQRIYGVQRMEVFSQENFATFLGGVTVNYEMAEYLVDVVPERIDYMYGKGFLTPFLLPIPRAIWKSKPVASDQPINELVYGTNYQTNTGVTIIAEMYQNFGIFAPLGMFFIGKFVRGYNRYLRQNDHNLVVWIAWFMIIPDFATEWRGGFTSMTGSIIIRFSFFLGLIWLTSKLFRQGYEFDYQQYTPELSEYGSYGYSPYI